MAPSRPEGSGCVSWKRILRVSPSAQPPQPSGADMAPFPVRVSYRQFPRDISEQDIKLKVRMSIQRSKELGKRLRDFSL